MSEKKRIHEDIEFEDYNKEEEHDSDDEQLQDNNNSQQEDGDDDNQEVEDDEEELVDEDQEDDDEEDDENNIRAWRPGVDKLEEDEFLTYDCSAYDMMHTMTVEWPCLSFHPIKDTLGAQRNKYPHTMYLVSGTQADQSKNNKIIVMKVSDLCKTKHDQDETDDEISLDGSDTEKQQDDEDDDDDFIDDNDQEVTLVSNYINHNGCVNRIRSMEQQSNIVASWSDNKQVYIWNIQNNLNELEQPTNVGNNNSLKNQLPIHVISNHKDEGYALDWSPVVIGRLATGDCNKEIYITNAAGSTWKTDTQPYKGHEASVEDIQWSPSEGGVFASCSSDQSIKIWDIRQHSKPAISIHAHDADVNVISWSRRVEYLLASGSDDGSFRVWDLRNFKSDKPVSHFNYHSAPITSLEWNPWDESQLIVSSYDNQVTVWDFSLEEDTEEFNGTKGESGQEDYQIPPQLFFIHQGQSDVKEVHWHPQIPHAAITTAIEGFNIFKSSNSEE